MGEEPGAGHFQQGGKGVPCSLVNALAAGKDPALELRRLHDDSEGVVVVRQAPQRIHQHGRRPGVTGSSQRQARGIGAV